MLDNDSGNFLRHFRRAFADTFIGDGVFHGLHEFGHAILVFQLIELLETIDPEHDPMPAPWSEDGTDNSEEAFTKHREEWSAWVDRRFMQSRVRPMRRVLYSLLRARVPRAAREEVPLMLQRQFEAICEAQVEAERLALTPQDN